MAKNKTNKKRTKPKGSAGKKRKPMNKTVNKKLAKKRGTPKKKLAKKKPALKKAAVKTTKARGKKTTGAKTPTALRTQEKARAWTRRHLHSKDRERGVSNREIYRDCPTSKVRILRVWPS